MPRPRSFQRSAAPTVRARRFSACGRYTERVAVGVGEHHPGEVAEVVPPRLGCAEPDQALDLRLDVGGAEVDVYPHLSRRRVVDLLEGQAWTLGPAHDDEKRWRDGVYLPVERTGPPVGELLGVGGVERDVLGLESHALDPR